MDIQFKEINKPDQSLYLKQQNVRRKTERGGNMRYENILFATDADAD